jgi:ATP-dependent DNA helicase
LSDDEFEQKLAEEVAGQGEDQGSEGSEGSQEEIERAKTLELASKLHLTLPSGHF